MVDARLFLDLEVAQHLQTFSFHFVHFLLGFGQGDFVFGLQFLQALFVKRVLHLVATAALFPLSFPIALGFGATCERSAFFFTLFRERIRNHLRHVTFPLFDWFVSLPDLHLFVLVVQSIY